MYELHAWPTPNGYKVSILLEELGLPYVLHLLPFPPRVHRKDFLELNPLGTVPLLLLSSGLTRVADAEPSAAEWWQVA